MDKQDFNIGKIFLAFFFFNITLYLSTGIIQLGAHGLLMFSNGTSDFPTWVYVYAYSYCVLTFLLLIWTLWKKNDTYILIYITVTMFINLDIAYYLAPEYTIAILQKMFPFLYWPK